MCEEMYIDDISNLFTHGMNQCKVCQNAAAISHDNYTMTNQRFTCYLTSEYPCSNKRLIRTVKELA